MAEGAAYDPLEGSDKYRVIKELGRGGMGEVFLGEHIALGTQVVIKLLHLELSNKSGLVDRMRLEAQACARLNHPNIVRVTDFDRTPRGRPYFVMEYLPGQALSEEAEGRGGYLPVAEALDMTRQALDGLAYAHEAGLIHRDIKLDNLFVVEPKKPTDKKVVKILDFGVAKVTDTGGDDAPAPLMVPTGMGVVVGTPRFFAPEQARGQKLDHRADIYAMGLVLYNLVAGRGPFDHCQTITEMARAHVLTPPAPPSQLAPQPIPPALDQAVLRAIAKTPDERWPSAEAFAQALAAIDVSAAAPAHPNATAYQTPAASSPSLGGVSSPAVHQSGHGYPAPTASGSMPAVTASGATPAPTTQPSGHATQSMGTPPAALTGATPAPAAGPKRYGYGVAAAVVLVCGLLGAGIAMAALNMM